MTAAEVAELARVAEREWADVAARKIVKTLIKNNLERIISHRLLIWEKKSFGDAPEIRNSKWGKWWGVPALKEKLEGLGFYWQVFSDEESKELTRKLLNEKDGGPKFREDDKIVAGLGIVEG